MQTGVQESGGLSVGAESQEKTDPQQCSLRFAPARRHFCCSGIGPDNHLASELPCGRQQPSIIPGVFRRYQVNTYQGQNHLSAVKRLVPRKSTALHVPSTGVLRVCGHLADLRLSGSRKEALLPTLHSIQGKPVSGLKTKAAVTLPQVSYFVLLPTSRPSKKTTLLT